MYPNRTLCQVLEEMRGCYKSRNFASLMGLIEEAQSMGNRMESSLFDKKDYNNIIEKIKVAQQELDDLNNAIQNAKSVPHRGNKTK